MASHRSFPLLFVLLFATGLVVRPADAKPRDLSTYTLRVHIFTSEWKSDNGGSGTGRGNLIDGATVRGFDFVYYCQVNYMASVGNQAYTAKWKKPGKTIEIVGNKVGSEGKEDTCDFNVTMHDYVYDVRDGSMITLSPEQYKSRAGTALLNSGPVDSDLAHYPLRLSILQIDWSPPFNGVSTGNGRGNLLSPAAGLASVDFATSCNVTFATTPPGRYDPGQWSHEGSEMAVLLQTVSAGPQVCILKTSIHTDIYMRDASGVVKAVSPEEFRRLNQPSPSKP
jgi:hypothetical protein